MQNFDQATPKSYENHSVADSLASTCVKSNRSGCFFCVRQAGLCANTAHTKTRHLANLHKTVCMGVDFNFQQHSLGIFCSTFKLRNLAFTVLERMIIMATHMIKTRTLNDLNECEMNEFSSGCVWLQKKNTNRHLGLVAQTQINRTGSNNSCTGDSPVEILQCRNSPLCLGRQNSSANHLKLNGLFLDQL